MNASKHHRSCNVPTLIRTQRHVHKALCCALLGIGFLSHAEESPLTNLSQDTEQRYHSFDKLPITGSSIVRKELTQTLPVQVISRSDILHSGKNDIAELLQALPVMSSFTSPADVGYLQGGSSSAAIHGMQSGTVVLINGQRVVSYGRQYISGVNIGSSELNLLPLSAIDRIEVLTDGASTVYGTDALAGVINIITRNERTGVEITAEQRLPDHSKGQSSRIDLSASGGRFQRDGYSWFIAADIQNQAALQGADRPYAAQGRYDVLHNGSAYAVYNPQIRLSQSGPALSDSPTEAFSKAWSARGEQGRCPGLGTPVSGQNACYDNPANRTDLTPDTQAARLHAQGQFKINENNIAFIELGLQKNKQTRKTRTWGSYVTQIADQAGAPGYDLAVAQGLNPADGAWLHYSPSELGLGTHEFSMQTVRLTTGLKGQWKEWDYRASIYHSNSTVRYAASRFSDYPDLGTDENGYLNNPALLAPLYSNTPASQTLLAQLQGMREWRDTDQGSSNLTGLSAQGSRTLGEVLGQDVLLAIGTDLRETRDRYETYMPWLTQPSYQGKRTVWAQFAELQVPVHPQIETVASLRNDHYSDFGNTTHAKLATKWTPSEQWLIRGAVGTGFKAPTIAQTQALSDIVSISPASSACTLALLRNTALGTCPENSTYWMSSQGNPDLKPELSRHISWGLRFSPSRNQSIWVDYWRVQIRDKINTQTSTLNHTPLRSVYDWGSEGSGSANIPSDMLITTSMINTGQTYKSGLDFGWALREHTDWGQLQTRINGTWMLNSRYQQTNDSAWVSDLNTLSHYDGYVVPRLRLQLSAALSRPNWHFAATANYINKYDDGGFTGVHQSTGLAEKVEQHIVPSYWTLNVSMSHEISREIRLRMGIDNLFNRQSPLSFGSPGIWNFGTNPMYASIAGRTVILSATYLF